MDNFFPLGLQSVISGVSKRDTWSSTPEFFYKTARISVFQSNVRQVDEGSCTPYDSLLSEANLSSLSCQ